MAPPGGSPVTRRSEQSDAGQRTVCLLSVSTCPRCQEDGTESRQRRQAHGKSCRTWSAAGSYRQGCSARPGGAAVTPLPSAWIVPRQAQSGWSTRVGKAPRAEPRQAAQGAPAPGGSAHTVPGRGGVSRRVPQSLPPPPLSGTRTACGDHVTLLFTCSLTCGSSPTHQEVPAQTGPPSPPNPRAGFPLSQPEPSSPCFCLLVELPKTMEGNAFC